MENEKSEMNEKKYLGIDIGGTAIKLGIINDAFEVLYRSETPVDRDGEEHVMETVFRAVEELLDEASLEAHALAGIGVSAAGCVEKDRGAIAKNGGNVPNWSHTEVAGPLSERFGVTATLVNDGNAVALGEQCAGAASGSDDVLCIVIGTGIGGGIITGGKLIEGRDAKEVADILRGNDCNMKGTSCADQLARAIDEHIR